MSKQLTQRFETALLFAFQLHKDQYRKQSEILYFSHLLAVTAIVLENGGTENQAIAALLHDAVEDQGGYETLEKIADLFGEEVADIVDGCTDSYTDPKPDWEKRKSDYILKLKKSPEATKLVSLADKVHNARAILSDLKSMEKDVWGKFTGGKSGTLWYYRSLVEIFRDSSFRSLFSELQELVAEITAIADTRE